MNSFLKFLRLGLLALFLMLLIGIPHLRQQPLLWTFIALYVAGRAAELFHPAAEALANWHRSGAYPRWLNWLSGLIFITNVALPILDHRYRAEGGVFWNSPLPIATWWSWLGALGVLAGVALRWQTFSHVPKPQKPAAAKAASKRKRAPEEEAEIPQYHAGYLSRLQQQFNRAAGLAYFGIAILFTSLWGLLAVVIVFLPILLHRHEVKEHAATS